MGSRLNFKFENSSGAIRHSEEEKVIIHVIITFFDVAIQAQIPRGGNCHPELVSGSNHIKEDAEINSA